MLISEVFGYGVENQSAEAWDGRNRKHCPFRDTACTKSSISDPIGICSLADGSQAAAICPVRFLEGARMFADAAQVAFGPNPDFEVFPEVRILKIVSGDPAKRDRKIGKVDFLIGKLDGGRIVDFAAVEVQSSYFSGIEIRSPLRYFMENRALDAARSDRRPDFRSSAQKRLMPQLQLKVPVFRRWGKKFMVVVDTLFHASMPPVAGTTANNSELTWLAYPIAKTGPDFVLQKPEIHYTTWDDVQHSLREGVPPDPDEIVRELQHKLDQKRKSKT